MHATAPRPRSALRAFLNHEASGGIVLMGSAALALVVANSPVSGAYFAVLHSYVLGLSVLHWVNDALMALFFLMVGLKIKCEMLDGQLSTWHDDAATADVPARDRSCRGRKVSSAGSILVIL